MLSSGRAGESGRVRRSCAGVADVRGSKPLWVCGEGTLGCGKRRSAIQTLSCGRGEGALAGGGARECLGIGRSVFDSKVNVRRRGCGRADARWLGRWVQADVFCAGSC